MNATRLLQSPLAIARLKSAQIMRRREEETFDSEVVKQILEKFGNRIHEFAQTPEGLAASDHALDWEFEQGWKHTRKTKRETGLIGLWEEMEV